MSIRSFVFTSLFSLCIAAPVLAIGCAAPTDVEDPEEQLAETQDELTAAASQLVGSYYTHSLGNGGFARLELKASGKYSAKLDPAGTIVCVVAPCLLPESGTWNASKSGKAFRLRLTPSGQSSRSFATTKTSTGLTLSRSGKTQTLSKLGATQCIDNSDCSSNNECAPRACLMHCLVDDPFCCGPSTCEPKAPSACFGAWLDQFGGCRGPADQGLAPSCCAGLSTPCGANSCGVGKVCCNPLAGICTNPGEFCIQ